VLLTLILVDFIIDSIGVKLMNNERPRVPLYVLNNFLKFDRKIYQVFGLQLGRPLPLKGIVYFFIIGGIELVWYFTPVLNKLITWIAPAILIAIPIVLSWLLVDVGTEGRSPFAYFRSFMNYYIRKFKNVTYVRGKEVKKPKTHSFKSYVTYGQPVEDKPKKVKYKGYVTYR